MRIPAVRILKVRMTGMRKAGMKKGGRRPVEQSIHPGGGMTRALVRLALRMGRGRIGKKPGAKSPGREEEMERTFWKIDHDPGGHNGFVVVALAGPLDVGMAATRALSHLKRAAGAGLFARVDPDAVFDYSQEMPLMTQDDAGLTRIRWPGLELFESGVDAGTPGQPGPLFMMGRRPNLNLMSFTEDLGRMLRGWGIRHIVHLSSGFAHVCHRNPVQVSISGAVPGPDAESELAVELREIEDRMGESMKSQPLQDSALVHACLESGMGYAAVCGHCPTYLTGGVNEQVAAVLARTGKAAALAPGSLEAADEAEREYLEMLSKTMERNPQFRMMVEATENQVRMMNEATDEKSSLLPREETEAVAGDLEEFLRKERERNGS